MAGGVSIGKGATSHLVVCVCLYVPWRESVRGVCMVSMCGGEWRQVSGACSWLSEWGVYVWCRGCLFRDAWVELVGSGYLGAFGVFAMCQRVYGVGG